LESDGLTIAILFLNVKDFLWHFWKQTVCFRLPCDRLRVNGGVLKSFKFSVHAELVEA
jgi:hypothetical protein